MSKHLHNISAVLSAGKFVHLSNFYIDYLPHWNALFILYCIHCTQRFYQFLLSGACQSTQQLYSATATVFDELYFLVSPTVNSV